MLLEAGRCVNEQLGIDRKIERVEGGAQISAPALEREMPAAILQLPVDLCDDIVDRCRRIADRRILRRPSEHPDALRSNGSSDAREKAKSGDNWNQPKTTHYRVERSCWRTSLCTRQLFMSATKM